MQMGVCDDYLDVVNRNRRSNQEIEEHPYDDDTSNFIS
jgi:hypothetical protein